MTRLTGALGALLLCSFLTGAPITGLFNTGVTSAGLQLPGGLGIPDPHWLQNGNPAVTFTVGSPPYIDQIGPAPGSTASKWISVDGQGGGSFTVPFTLTFDLTGTDPATAFITGRWAVDNCGTGSLNGNAAFTTISACNTSTSFTGWTNFTIGSGFLPGLNTLSFNVTTPDSTGAVRVEFLSSNVEAVPEPGTTALLLSGVAGAALWRRRLLSA